MAISASTWYKIGSVSMALIGVGHTSIHFSMKGKNPSAAAILEQMDAFKVLLPGMGSRSLLEFHEGFSITMGILLFFVGLQNFFLAPILMQLHERAKAAPFIPLVLSGILFLLSLTYFILPPQALSLVALVAYCLSWWKAGREKPVSE